MAGLKNSSLRLRRFLWVILALLAFAAPDAFAQEGVDLRITGIDLSGFPDVRVRVLATDGQSAPFPGPVGYVLREDGVPIPDLRQARVPAGVDLALVIDANASLLQSDDGSGVIRRDILAESISRFANERMSPVGLDRVSVIAPDETGEASAFLLEDATRPADLGAAIDGYRPAELPRAAPLTDMLAAAVDHLAATGDDGKFQAVVVYTDGGRVASQVDYQAIVEQAQAAGVPIFAVILGQEASQEEINAVAGLYEPTRGQFLHLPEPGAADPFYALFEDNGQQVEVQYRSLLRQRGEHEVSVTLGNTTATTPFTLDLRAPVLALDLPATAIKRVGSAADTPLALLQPAVQPLMATITWPDGARRALADFQFLVNGQPARLAEQPAPDAAGQILIPWDISELDEGAYTLEVRARDELGYEASSGPVAATIAVSRPAPTAAPAPTIAPTRASPLPIDLPIPDEQLPLLAGALGGLVVIGLGVFAWVRRRAVREARRRAALVVPPPIVEQPKRSDDHVPYLERLDASGRIVDRTQITGADLSIGRDPAHAALVIDDPTVSRLHARIRRNVGNEYWLYDEGSSAGTYLNYERLGLAPRQMHHGDPVTIGRVPFRFALELPDPAGSSASGDRPATGGPAGAQSPEAPAA